MLLPFFVIALIATVVGVGGVTGMPAEIGWVFAVLSIACLAVVLLSGRGPREIP